MKRRLALTSSVLFGLLRPTRAQRRLPRIGLLPEGGPLLQPARFEWVINLLTAKALGLTIEQALLLPAYEVTQ